MNDPINAYIWGCSSLNEVDEWGERFGIADVDIIGSFRSNDLAGFCKRAEIVEASFRQAINKNGIKLDEYNTVEDFLKTN